jgi:uncharacterized membrane protein YqjE
MKWPPMLAYVKIKGKKHGFGFWVPMFLGVLIMLAFFIAFLPLTLLVVLILWPTGWGRWVVEAIKTGYVMLCSTRGLKVDIQGPHETIYISVV